METRAEARDAQPGGFLSLPIEIRDAIYEHLTPPSSDLHVSCTEDEHLYSFTCRHVKDLDWIAPSFPGSPASDDEVCGYLARWTHFPNHSACLHGRTRDTLHEGEGASAHGYGLGFSLMLTCRFIYHDFAPFLYSRPNFIFHEWRAFNRFSSLVPASHQAYIRTMCLTWLSMSSRTAIYRTEQKGLFLDQAEIAHWNGMWKTFRRVSHHISQLEVYFRVPWSKPGTPSFAWLDAPRRLQYLTIGFAPRPPPSDAIFVGPHGRFKAIELSCPTFYQKMSSRVSQVSPGYENRSLDQRRLQVYVAIPDPTLHSWGSNVIQVLEIEVRRQSPLGNFRDPPWHESFGTPTPREQLTSKTNTADEREALTALSLLRSGSSREPPRPVFKCLYPGAKRQRTG